MHSSSVVVSGGHLNHERARFSRGVVLAEIIKIKLLVECTTCSIILFSNKQN